MQKRVVWRSAVLLCVIAFPALTSPAWGAAKNFQRTDVLPTVPDTVWLHVDSTMMFPVQLPPALARTRPSITVRYLHDPWGFPHSCATSAEDDITLHWDVQKGATEGLLRFKPGRNPRPGVYQTELLFHPMGGEIWDGLLWMKLHRDLVFYCPPPPAPSDLRALERGCAYIKLLWIDNATNETGFTVERNGTAIAALSEHPGTGAVTYLDTPLAENAAFSYRVRANLECESSDFTPKLATSTTSGCAGNQGARMCCTKGISPPHPGTGEGFTVTWSFCNCGDANYGPVSWKITSNDGPNGAIKIENPGGTVVNLAPGECLTRSHTNNFGTYNHRQLTLEVTRANGTTERCVYGMF